MALIENPILNSPFLEPARHFKFDEDGITNDILNGRRSNSHFVPIPRAKKRGKQLQFETEWTKDRLEPNPVVDRIRLRVGAWPTLSQYFDSRHSLSEIAFLAVNSLRLYAASASSSLAPTDPAASKSW